MDATAGWDATLRLRSWERAQLGLAHGERLLDVGCGRGEAALGLAQDLGEDGEVVGVDIAESMLRVARSNAAAAPCRVRFTLGDACSLDEPDASFDAVRSERTLEWLAHPAAAVAEMVRVVRPGGRVSLIDTDWSTFTIDVGDDAVAALVRDGCERSAIDHPTSAGGCTTSSGPPVAIRSREPRRRRPGRPGIRSVAGPRGCFSMESLADDLVATDRLPIADRGGSSRRSTTPRDEVSSGCI